MCSPSRYSLHTGHYASHGLSDPSLNIWRNALDWPSVENKSVIGGRNIKLRGTESTAGHLFKAAGYRTGFVGKWHLGYDPKFSPIKQGFDEFIGFVSGNVDYHSHLDQEGYEDWWKGDTLSPETGYSTDLISKHSIDFIKRNRNENFLLYVAHESPHYP